MTYREQKAYYAEEPTYWGRAMNAFDRLMERYAYEAQRALEEWDRR